MATVASSPRPNFLASWAARPQVQTALGTAFLLTLTLLVFGRILFAPGDLVLSDGEADLAKQFVHWRAFGFNELRGGHFALWNPHVFSGAPFFGGFQSALLYPPNWLYLCLPLAPAINLGIAIHVFLAGLFMQLWVGQRGMHPLACVLAGVLFMFSGPYFLHIHAGHLSNLCTMVWGPLIFLSIDGWLQRRTAGWLWLGAGAVALQILAGHPQYVFYTGVAAGLYCACHLCILPQRAQALAGLAVIVAGAAALSAVQLFEGFHVAGQTVRNHGTSPEFAAVFSFPPENLVTALVPGWFGDMNRLAYWGRFDLWEMSLFLGVTGLVLAVYGAVYGEKSRTRFCAGLAAVCLLVALGANTPLFTFLYRYAPGFGRFRGWSKFTYPAMLFLVVLAASGFDTLLRGNRPPRHGAALAILLGSGALELAAIWIDSAPGTAVLRGWIQALFSTGDLYQPKAFVESTDFVLRAARFAGWQCSLASGILLVVGILFVTSRRRPQIVRALLILASVEMVVFAGSTLTTFRLSDALSSPAALPAADDRLLNLENPNLGLSTGACDVWGYDPGVLRRYAEWIAVTQGMAADDATESLRFSNFPHTFAGLLRCHDAFFPTGPDGNYQAAGLQTGTPAGRLMLMSNVRVVPDRDNLLRALQSPDFDPRHCLFLQAPPDPLPTVGGPPGRVRLLDETSDTLTIEADLPSAAVLLITDTYCTGWRAHSLLPLSDSVQAHYNVLPADYFLRAIPLQAGHHRLLVEYLPTAFVVGKWVSLAALAFYALGGWLLIRRPAPPVEGANTLTAAV